MLETCAAHFEAIFRTVRMRSAETGKLIKCLVVIDAAGLSLSTLRHIGIIKQCAAIGKDNFPEGSRRVLIVNAPRTAAAIWAVISPLLPARTRSKVSIVSARHSAAALDEMISPEELPQFLGGRKPDAECWVARAEAVPVGAGASLTEGRGASGAAAGDRARQAVDVPGVRVVAIS